MKKIERPKFDYLMADLAEIYTPLSNEAIDIYYNRLNNIEEYWLEKAVKILQDEHPFKRFPLPKEIRDAVQEAHIRSAEESLGPPEGCESCNLTGLKLEGNGASPCSCPLGQTIAKGWKKHGIGRYKISLR